MTHVAMLVPTLDRIGGAERQVTLLAKGLRARGWRVTIITLAGSGGEARAELAAVNVGFLSLAMRKGLADPRGWMRLNRWLRRECPEIVHAHLPHAAWLARWSRLAGPVRVTIDTVHTSSAGTAGRRWGYRLSRWLADSTTTVGEGVRSAYLDAGMIAADRSSVIPNGVDTDFWMPEPSVRMAVRSELELHDEFLWFAAGRLEAVKDYATMLRAFSQVPEASHLMIAGAGPLEGELRGLAAALGIEDRVLFLGFVRDVRRWMQATDSFVISSRWEGLPVAPIEAAACGLPAVATDVPGTREVVVDGETGWLVPAGSPTLLAEKMRVVMSASTEERAAMGGRARLRTIERYGLGSVLDRWEEHYRELLARNPRPRRWARKI